MCVCVSAKWEIGGWKETKTIHLPGKLMRAAKLVTLTKRGELLHLRNNGQKAFVTRIVPKQLTSSCLSNGSSDLPNSTSPVARMPALLTTANSSVYVRCEKFDEKISVKMFFFRIFHQECIVFFHYFNL